MRFRFLIILFAVSSGLHLSAQEVRNLQESRQMMQMDEAVAYMNKGQFALADDLFKEVLKNVEIVPADLCFYFGKNSYHLNQYSQSIDWLNKYIELKGTSGRFFDQAVEYIQLAESDLKDSPENERLSDSRPVRKSPSLDCEQYPFVVCPVCQGEGVIVEQGPLGSSVYKACQSCEEKGKMACEDYNLYIRGKLNP